MAYVVVIAFGITVIVVTPFLLHRGPAPGPTPGWIPTWYRDTVRSGHDGEVGRSRAGANGHQRHAPLSQCAPGGVEPPNLQIKSPLLYR